jgi:mono/diheme cytochrome c family protein
VRHLLALTPLLLLACTPSLPAASINRPQAASTSQLPAANAANPGVQAQVSFQNDVAPILTRSCAGCHSPGKPGVGNLAVFDAAGKVRSDTIVAGIASVISQTESGRMPRGGRPKLSADEVALLKRWRTEGLPVD